MRMGLTFSPNSLKFEILKLIPTYMWILISLSLNQSPFPNHQYKGNQVPFADTKSFLLLY